jgi:hypothetical protein
MLKTEANRPEILQIPPFGGKTFKKAYEYRIVFFKRKRYSYYTIHKQERLNRQAFCQRKGGMQ